MNTEIIGFKSGFLVAGGDLSAKKNYMVKMHTTNGQCVICGVEGEPSIGILAENSASGYIAPVVHYGVFPAIYGGAVTAGDALMVNASGKVITHTGTNTKVGMAIESGANNEIHSILVLPSHIAGYSAHYGTWIYRTTLAGIANGDLITNWTPGFAGTLVSLHAFVYVAATTAAKAATLNLEIGATNTTGGALALTSANMTPKGAVVNASAITAANVFTNVDTISLEASGVTTFIEGEIDVVIVYKT